MVVMNVSRRASMFRVHIRVPATKDTCWKRMQDRVQVWKGSGNISDPLRCLKHLQRCQYYFVVVRNGRCLPVMLKDLDECVLGTDTCSDICVNKPGGYECACPSGHALEDERYCVGETCCTCAIRWGRKTSKVYSSSSGLFVIFKIE